MSARWGISWRERDLGKNLLLLALILFLLVGAPATAAPPFTSSVVSTATWDTDQEYPALWQDRIVWQSLVDGNIEIVLYNSTSGEERLLTQGGSDEIHPDVYNNFIVWEDWSNQNYDLVAYDLETGDTLHITDEEHDQVNPSIWGQIVAWEDFRTGIPAIFLYDLGSGQEHQASADLAGCAKPDVWGDYIVWQQDCDNNSEIFLYFIHNDTPVRITHDPDDQQFPSIWGDRIVWTEFREDYVQISLYNITTGIETNLTSDPWHHEFPQIFGDYVAYESQKDYYDISVKNVITGEDLLVTPDTAESAQNQPALWDNRIAWRDSRDMYYDIHLCTIGTEKSPLAADFLVNETMGLPPLAIAFTDCSTGELGGWNWDFGDGNTSLLRDPVHVYQEPGRYPVTLTVHNPSQRAAVRKENLITAGAPPSADFSADIQCGPQPLNVHFTDNTGGYPTTWVWNFGDGSNSTDQNPFHLYTVPGTYAVSLYAENQWGNNTARKEAYITVMDAQTFECMLPGEGIEIIDIDGISLASINTTFFVPSGFNPTNDSSSVACIPDPSSGIALIQFFSPDATGFSYSGNDTIRGNISGLDITSMDYRSENQDPGNGLVWFYNFSAFYPVYEMNGKVTSRIWEGSTPDDSLLFESVASSHHYHVNKTAFTLVFAQESLSPGGAATIIFGIDSEWIHEHGSVWPVLVESDPEGALVYVDSEYAGHTPVYVEQGLSGGSHTLTVTSQGCEPNVTNFTVEERRDSVRVIHLSDGGEESFLNVTFLSHDNTTGMDYFSVISPEGFSKFAVVTTWQEGSPIQMLYLTLQRVLAPPSGSDGGGSRAAGGSIGGGGQAPAPAPTSGTRQDEETVPVTRQTSVQKQEPEKPSIEEPREPATEVTRQPAPEASASTGIPPILNQVTFNLVKNVSVLFVVFLVAIILYMRFRKEE